MFCLGISNWDFRNVYILLILEVIKKGDIMAENNFILVIVGIVAIVAVVGILNFNGVTGKLTGGTNVIQTSSEMQTFSTQWECEDNGKYSCDSFLMETTEPGASVYKYWECGDRLCHRLYYRN